MRIQAALGVLYAEDFDASAPAGAPEPELIEPMFTLADLDHAKAQAASSAGAEALASAELSALQDRSSALDAIAAGLLAGQDAIAAEIARDTHAVSQAMLALLSAALPSLMDGTARREVSGLMQRLLPGLYGEKRVTIRLNPHVIDMVDQDLRTLNEDARARIVLVPTDALAPGDMRVSWEGGSFVRDTRALHDAAREIITASGMEDIDGQ